MTDAFDALRLPDIPQAPRPRFAAELRSRIADALGRSDTSSRGNTMTTDTAAPESLHTITPYITCAGARDAIDWYVEHLGATLQGEPFPMGPDDDRVGHAEIRIGDSVVMLSDEWPEGGVVGPVTLGGSSFAMVLYVDDVDDVFARALAAGATEQRPVEDQFHGNRSGWLVDPWGHRWNIATHIEDLSHEEMLRRMDDGSEA